MEYKLYDHKFEWKGNFKKAANLVEQAFQELGYKEGLGYSGNGWMVYNHTCLDNMWDPIGTLEKQILIVIMIIYVSIRYFSVSICCFC